MSNPKQLPRRVRRRAQRQIERAEKALARGDYAAAAKLGLSMRHRIKLIRNGETILDLGDSK